MGSINLKLWFMSKRFTYIRANGVSNEIILKILFFLLLWLSKSWASLLGLYEEQE